MLDLSTILLMGRDLAASANEKTELRAGLEAYRQASPAARHLNPRRTLCSARYCKIRCSSEQSPLPVSPTMVARGRSRIDPQNDIFGSVVSSEPDLI